MFLRSAVLDYAKARGGACSTPVTDELSGNVFVEWTCSRGHVWSSQIKKTVGLGQWCRACWRADVREIRHAGTSSRRVWCSVDELVRIAEGNGGRCLTTEAVALNGGHATFLCRVGHKWTARVRNVVTGTWCGACKRTKVNKEGYVERAQKAKLRSKKHYEDNSEAYKDRASARYRSVGDQSSRFKAYGITLANYKEMLSRQKGACYICLGVQDKALSVDHCHITGKVRGLLCHKCNSAIGMLQDDPALALRAYQYLIGESDDS